MHIWRELVACCGGPDWGGGGGVPDTGLTVGCGVEIQASVRGRVLDVQSGGRVGIGAEVLGKDQGVQTPGGVGACIGLDGWGLPVGVQTEVRGLGVLRSRGSDGSLGRGGVSVGFVAPPRGFRPKAPLPSQHDVILVFLVMELLTQPFPKQRGFSLWAGIGTAYVSDLIEAACWAMIRSHPLRLK